MHGTVQNSFFRTKNIDIGRLLQVDTYTPAVIINNAGDSSYRLNPFTTTNEKLQYSKWIWDTSNAWQTTDMYIYLWFYYSFYSASSYTGTIWCGQPTLGGSYLYFNNIMIYNEGSGVEFYDRSYTVTINIGVNNIKYSAYNFFASAGLILALYDNNNIFICGTSDRWSMSTSSAFNTGALLYNI